MKHFPAPRFAVLAIALCLVQAAGQAATVGRPVGAVLVGQPLEVVVPLVLDGAGDSAAECAEVEVFYGDSKVPAGNVRTDLQTGPRGPAVRVRSGSAVNEPVVTIYLQLGCASRLTRRLVLLAEPDPGADVQRQFVAAAAPFVPSQAAERTSSVVPANLAPSRDRPAAVQPVASAPRRVKSSRPQTAIAAGGRRADANLLPAVQATPAMRNQLKLDVPIGVAEPAAPPDEALRQAARLESIERDLRDMRQLMQRTDAAYLQLQAQLARAQSQRGAELLVYALAVLLAVMAGVVAWLWRRAAPPHEASPDTWWRSPKAERDALRAAAASAVSLDDRDAAARRPGPPSSFRLGDASSADQALAGRAPMPPTVRVPLAGVTARTDDSLGSQAGSRALKAEELHDVQQEADFFSSLGEYDRAIDVLRSHIQAHPETSAVAWLDLVEIYHKLGRRDEFDWVRGEFQHRFNAQVPAFDEYSQESAGIEAYANAMARIAALWPSRRVLGVIEESIFRGPSKDGAGAFSLQAYRELLLLHHIGQQVLGGGASDSQRRPFNDSGPVSGAQSDFGSNGFSHTSIHPLSTGLTSLDHSPGGDGALDFNLDEPQMQATPHHDAYLLDFDLPDASSTARAEVTRVGL
ncbi:MAG: hypothetical protein NVS2B4_00690 [Ramlibacter sp.]